MATEPANHWEHVYANKRVETVSWFEETPAPSMRLINDISPPPAAGLDVGSGASRLIDALVDAGYGPVTAADLSATALKRSQDRLGRRADGVQWVVTDVTTWSDPPSVDIWHDRAVFHFLSDAARQAAYLATLARAVRPGGHAIIATFALEGPEACSGLPVQRQSPQTLAALIDDLHPGLLTPVSAAYHDHVTPGGRVQTFQISVFRRS